MDITVDYLDSLLADANNIMQEDGITQPSCSRVISRLKAYIIPLYEQIKKLRKKNAEQEAIISQQKDMISKKDETISNLSAAVRNLSDSPSSHPPCTEGADPKTEDVAENPISENDYGYRMPNKLDNLIFWENIEGKELDLQKLWRWIAGYFIKQLKYKYDWFALWKILIEKGFIRGSKQESIDFEKQMRKWFPDVKKPCKADAINCYRYPYLGVTDSACWSEEMFEKKIRGKQRMNGFTRLKERCDYMRPLLQKQKMMKGI